MAKRTASSVFGGKRRIRLGIWGLGRGMSFYKTCQALNFDVVAGCDYNAHMRARFLEQTPDALVTDNAEEFLASDIDAVLLATYCVAHADDAIKCLEAGKHVLSEVTAFHSMAEGVRLVEAVERTGRVYNLAENYPFTRPLLFLADRWEKGLFGEFEYAEFEYVHEIRTLGYTYIDGTPIQPGYSVHNWRSWLNWHYYNTHSLGPVMHITRTRPVQVVSLPCDVKLPGYLGEHAMAGMGSVAPSLIRMSNGGLMRNLMGSTTNDSHIQRIWGTRGSAELNHGLFLRLGGAGGSHVMEVEPEWPDFGKLAASMGHGGGDFWVLYHFARQILTGEPAFFDVYSAADCTIPGILGYRSALQGGRAFDVPDFRVKKDRDACRKDQQAQPRYDVRHGCFPGKSNPKVTGRFSTVMKNLDTLSTLSRSVLDWTAVIDTVKEPEQVLAILDRFISEHDALRKTAAEARRLVRAHPRSDAARVLKEMLELGEINRTARPSFRAEAIKIRRRLRRKRD